MHSGFKGTRIGITELILKDSFINYEISFIDSEGVVHARMRHHRAVAEGSDMNTKVDALVTALLNEAALMHYASPATATPASDLASGGENRGIAETLGAGATAPDEPEGTPG